MTKFNVVTNSYYYETSEADPNDNWSRASTAADISVSGVEIADNYFDIALPAEYDPSKPLYLLWADYATGDSFGTDDNQFEAVDLFQDLENAERARLQLLCTEPNGYTRDDGTHIAYHAPWIGYFEKLNDLYVKKVEILNLH